ncbi:hypothetical protein PUN28_008462 [Cardiocondyla obscurior]|uniref:Uncharacterized protein n=1 Tax=Cardiocondyla obscurior TaxID=286306 RepID=A0AAW2FZG9_9HYME
MSRYCISSVIVCTSYALKSNSSTFLITRYNCSCCSRFECARAFGASTQRCLFFAGNSYDPSRIFSLLAQDDLMERHVNVRQMFGSKVTSRKSRRESDSDERRFIAGGNFAIDSPLDSWPS